MYKFWISYRFVPCDTGLKQNNLIDAIIVVQ